MSGIYRMSGTMRTNGGGGTGQTVSLGLLVCGGILHLCAFVSVSVYHELRIRQLEVRVYSLFVGLGTSIHEPHVISIAPIRPTYRSIYM